MPERKKYMLRCMYCAKLVTKISRHMQFMHKDKLASFPADETREKQRKQLLGNAILDYNQVIGKFGLVLGLEVLMYVNTVAHIPVVQFHKNSQLGPRVSYEELEKRLQQAKSQVVRSPPPGFEHVAPRPLKHRIIIPTTDYNRQAKQAPSQPEVEVRCNEEATEMLPLPAPTSTLAPATTPRQVQALPVNSNLPLPAPSASTLAPATTPRPVLAWPSCSNLPLPASSTSVLAPATTPRPVLALPGCSKLPPRSHEECSVTRFEPVTKKQPPRPGSYNIGSPIKFPVRTATVTSHVQSSVASSVRSPPTSPVSSPEFPKVRLRRIIRPPTESSDEDNSCNSPPTKKPRSSRRVQRAVREKSTSSDDSEPSTPAKRPVATHRRENVPNPSVSLDGTYARKREHVAACYKKYNMYIDPSEIDFLVDENEYLKHYANVSHSRKKTYIIAARIMKFMAPENDISQFSWCHFDMKKLMELVGIMRQEMCLEASTIASNLKIMQYLNMAARVSLESKRNPDLLQSLINMDEKLKSMYKTAFKDITIQKEQPLPGVSLDEFRAELKRAQDVFEKSAFPKARAIVDRAKNGKELNGTDRRTVNSVFMFYNMLRGNLPRAIQNILLHDFTRADQNTVTHPDGSKSYKLSFLDGNSKSHICMPEILWDMLRDYVNYVRSRVHVCREDSKYLFISSTGKKIHSPTSDLARRYILQPLTWQEDTFSNL